MHCCRELLDAGFKVRAGARNLDAAESNATIAGALGLLTPEQRGRLSFHEFDLTDPSTIAAAIGNANKVSSAASCARNRVFFRGVGIWHIGAYWSIRTAAAAARRGCRWSKKQLDQQHCSSSSRCAARFGEAEVMVHLLLGSP